MEYKLLEITLFPMQTWTGGGKLFKHKMKEFMSLKVGNSKITL